jgi:hypothetical protein
VTSKLFGLAENSILTLNSSTILKICGKDLMAKELMPQQDVENDLAFITLL